MNDKHQPNRPTLGAEGAQAQEAIDAVARLVEELQAGWDQHDATSRTCTLPQTSCGAARSVRPSTATRSFTPSMFV
jgi:hypothetical protein